ncbi:MAG: hypothetical protein IJI35_07680 [Kiritimatiellae bacterium]|nr:hypothetical protein [Kiritimatiellia bacterium]
MRKVGVLAAACVAACAAGAAGFKAQPGYLIAAEQKSNSIVAIDARQAGAPAWAWEWKASRDPGIAKGDAKLFYAPSDCKVGGDSVLMIASGGNFAELSLATGLAVCYGHVGGNPHSITRLPGKGMFATASSVSHSVTIVSTADNPFSPELQPKKAYPLTSAHGVEWDAKRNCLWALGHTNLVRYAWSETQFELSAVRDYDFRPVGGGGGHDLAPDGAGGYFITTGKCLVHFDPDAGEFRLVERLKDIKAYSPNKTWGNAYTTVRTVWWTDRIIVKKGDEERVIGPYPGAKFYKARWMK